MTRLPGKIRRFRPQRSARRKLPFLAAPNLRMAQVTGPGSPFDSVEMFAPDRWEELENFRPAVLIGDAADLQLLAYRVSWDLKSSSKTQRLDLSSVDHAIFVLTECGSMPATDVLRVVLWQAFGVPVYELLIGAVGRLLAAECEAHEGWHVQTGAKLGIVNNEVVLDPSGREPIGTGLTGFLQEEACACGRFGPRLMNIGPLERHRKLRELAATA